MIDNTELSDTKSLTKHLFVRAGAAISYQWHAMRNEIWILIDSVGELVIGGQRKPAGHGGVVRIEKDYLHALLVITDI